MLISLEHLVRNRVTRITKELVELHLLVAAMSLQRLNDGLGRVALVNEEG